MKDGFRIRSCSLNPSTRSLPHTTTFFVARDSHVVAPTFEADKIGSTLWSLGRAIPKHARHPDLVHVPSRKKSEGKFERVSRMGQCKTMELLSGQNYEFKI